MTLTASFLTAPSRIACPSGPARVVASSLVLNDVDDLAQLFPSSDMEFAQVGAGCLQVLAWTVQVPGAVIRWLDTNRCLRARGTPRTAQYVFTPITPANEGWRFRGCRLRAGDITISRAGEELDEIYSPNSEGLSIAIDEDLLHEALASSSDGVLSRELAFRPTVNAFRRFQSQLDHIGKTWMDNPSELSREELTALVRAGCLEAVAAVLDHAPRESEFQEPRGRRLEIALEAERIMERHLAPPLTTPRLCEELGVRRRLLFYAFQEAFGASPMAYYKIKRLGRVRRELKHADPTSTIIRQVALRWGFHHPSQFAQDYARHYGERPSETLLKKRGPGPGERTDLREETIKEGESLDWRAVEQR